MNIGFCGAYTTFSTFEYETSASMSDGQMLFALANVIGSVILGFVGIRLGIPMARWFSVPKSIRLEGEQILCRFMLTNFVRHGFNQLYDLIVEQARRLNLVARPCCVAASAI